MVSHIGSIQADKAASNKIGSEVNIKKRDALVSIDLDQNEKEAARNKHESLIDDSETILRLKRRIKNRIIGQENQPKSQLRHENSYLKQNAMRVNPIYY